MIVREFRSLASRHLIQCKKFMSVFVLVMALFGSTAALAVVPISDVAYVRGVSQPWGVVTNEAAMDLAFGPGNWLSTTMVADAGAVFNPANGYRTIFLEGSDFDALELAAYLNAHRAAIEAWVAAGGRLLLNSAPNEGLDINFGFGGITFIPFSSEKPESDVYETFFV